MSAIGRHVSGALVAATCLWQSYAGAAEYVFIPEDSRVTVWVPRAGLFSFLGHDHTILVTQFEGELAWEEESADRAQLSFSTCSGCLKVIDKNVGEETRAEIQQTMEGEEVLNVAAHPRIRFTSTRIETGEDGKWTISGKLALRDETRDLEFTAVVTFPDDETVLAQGAVELRPANFGIEPVSAVGGTIRTADAIELRFEIMGRKASK